jgi:kynurenine formamidase
MEEPMAAPGPLAAPIARASRERMQAIFEKVKSWGRWGADDQRGALNLVTPERRARAAAGVETGEAVSLAHELPTRPSVENPSPAQHHMLLAGDALDATPVPGLGTSLDWIGVAFHGMAVSHLDALCHVFVDGRMYNGFPATDVRSVGAARNSVMVAADGIVGRGVLLDVPRLRGVAWLEPGEAVAPDELDAAERAQGVRVEEGDILLVGTGRDARRAARGPWSPTEVGLAGLHPECIPWLHERGVAVLGCDGVSDPLPGNAAEGWPIPVHQCCLVGMGVHLLDNLQLGRLAEACARHGRWAFFLSVAPLRVEGGTGSPVNPIAVF